MPVRTDLETKLATAVLFRNGTVTNDEISFDIREHPFGSNSQARRYLNEDDASAGNYSIENLCSRTGQLENAYDQEHFDKSAV